MSEHIPEEPIYTEARHLPIIKHFAKRINLVDTIDRLVGSQMEISPGLTVLAMVLDTLSGRSPLYRLKEFFDEKDSELLLGTEVDPAYFADYNVGRAMDQIYETGTQKIYAQIIQNALDVFEIQSNCFHFDTTSITVYGDYDCQDPPFELTYGHSKDKRPDLKQFVVSMLCVERNIPLLGACHNGNSSDKTLNNELLSNIGKHMAQHGLEPGAFIYVADAAYVTEDNLKKSRQRNLKVLSRLPASYSECSRVIQEAVTTNEWIHIGTLAESGGSAKRPPAYYKAFDTQVQLYENNYRAIVLHSSVHDKRRHKRIDRLLAVKRQQLEKLCKDTAAKPFFCRDDAQLATSKLHAVAKSGYHTLQIQIEEKAKYGRGRPANGQPRVPQGYQYILSYNIDENDQAVKPLRLEAGCFVLLTNLSTDQEIKEWPADKLLQLYKEQNGIEKNFSFLKDPVIVNSIFLKKPERIEVLGLILLISLLIWRLMERCMQQYVGKNNSSPGITGWKDRPTRKPTAFMMTTKFSSVLLVKQGKERKLARALKPVHIEYLKALGLTSKIFIVP
jgi:transposase